MKNYNYCCLFSKDDKCPSHNKTVVKRGEYEDIQPCDDCGTEMKLLGEATNVVFIGTQESKIKTRKS